MSFSKLKMILNHIEMIAPSSVMAMNLRDNRKKVINVDKIGRAVTKVLE